MKDPKLLVRVACVNRDFYLFRRVPGGDYYVRFETRSRDRRLAESSGRRLQRKVARSTGTKELAPAKRIAAQVIESYFKGGDWAGISEETKLKSGYATVGDILRVYERQAQEKPVTVRGYVRSMAMILRTVHGKAPNECSSALLSKQLIREFERRQFESRMAEERTLSGKAGENARELEIRLAMATQQVRNATAAYVRQAKSIVSRDKTRFYEGLKLPDLSEFRNEQVVKPRKSRPKPLDLNALTAMVAARAALRERDPAVYVANLLFSCWGMRDIEILHARVHWLSGGQMHIIDRAEENFFPKGAEGSFQVSADVVAEVLSFQHLCADGYLVPGKTMTDRHQAIYRRHSEWVKQWIRDHRKTSYELRRYAGSRLLDMGATIFEVRDFLRHRHVSTTEGWYAYRLGNRQLPVIGLSNLVPVRAVA